MTLAYDDQQAIDDVTTIYANRLETRALLARLNDVLPLRSW